MPAFLKWSAKAVHLDGCRLFIFIGQLPATQKANYKNRKLALMQQYPKYPIPDRFVKDTDIGRIANYTCQT